MSGRWCEVNGWRDIKVGMKVRSCLDMNNPIYRDEAEDDGSTSHIWYEAIVKRIRDNDEYDRDTRQIDVKRNDMQDGVWHTIITPNNIWAIKIWVTISDWDE